MMTTRTLSAGRHVWSEKPIKRGPGQWPGTVAIESRVDDVRLVAEDLRTGPFQCRCIRSVLKVRFE